MRSNNEGSDRISEPTPYSYDEHCFVGDTQTAIAIDRNTSAVLHLAHLIEERIPAPAPRRTPGEEALLVAKIREINEAVEKWGHGFSLGLDHANGNHRTTPVDECSYCLRRAA